MLVVHIARHQRLGAADRADQLAERNSRVCGYSLEVAVADRGQSLMSFLEFRSDFREGHGSSSDSGFVRSNRTWSL